MLMSCLMNHIIVAVALSCIIYISRRVYNGVMVGWGHSVVMVVIWLRSWRPVVQIRVTQSVVRVDDDVLVVLLGHHG